MRKIFEYKLQGLVLLLALAGLMIVSSCEETVEGTDDVVLLSFGPVGVKHGDEISFIGQNLDKVSSIVFKPAVEVEASSFVSHTSDMIKVAVPQAAEAGTVILKTPQGDLETKTILNFEVPVVISSITAEARPGANITITGQKINWIESVTFTSDLMVEQADFVSQNATELVLTVPMEAQSGFLIFRTGGTEPLTFGSEEQLTVTLPSVTSLEPNPIRHESSLTINGADLDLVKEVKFSGDTTITAIDFISHSASAIVVKVPANVITGTITLSQLSPIDVVTPELNIALPIGTAVSPVPAKPGEDNITISGTDLDLVARLFFPGVTEPTSTFVSKSETEIVVAVPAEAKSGSLRYTTIHGFSGNLRANLIIPAPGPLPLALTLYDDEVFFDGGNWSWGGTADPLSTEQAYSGSISFKHVTVGNDGGASVGGMSGVNATGLSVFKFAVYGGNGTDGKNLAVILNDTWGNYNTVVLKEGEWTEYSMPVSSYPDVDFSNITRWILKVEGASNAVIYVDRVGFDRSAEAVADESLVFFDFNGKNSWWGDVAIVNDPEKSADGTAFGHVNIESAGGDWHSLFFRNSSNEFPTALSGEDVSKYVLKFDIKVNKPINHGEIKFRLKGDSGDFMYLYGPSGPHTGVINTTSTWITVTVPINQFRDDFGHGANSPSDLGDLGGEFGAAYTYAGGTSELDFYIDNVRFHYNP